MIASGKPFGGLAHSVAEYALHRPIVYYRLATRKERTASVISASSAVSLCQFVSISAVALGPISTVGLGLE